MLDFLFERNEQDEISNIYNYPKGRGATQTIILRTVNCNEKLSEIIDVSPSYISEIERGSSICSLATLTNIANTLK